MSNRTLPHDLYISQVTDALTAAGLKPVEYWTSDGETKGVYCHLNAVITLDPGGTYELDDEDVPADTSWRHGLVLSWEWHTGAEDGWEKEPLWEFAALKADGSCQYTPATLPVLGYAASAAVVGATRRVIAHEIRPEPSSMFGGVIWDGGIIGGSWEQHAELDAACEAWGTDETSE